MSADQLITRVVVVCRIAGNLEHVGEVRALTKAGKGLE